MPRLGLPIGEASLVRQGMSRTDNPADALAKFLPEAELERHMAQMNYVYKNADLRVEKSTMEFPAHPGVDQETQIFQQAHLAGSFSM